MNKISWKDRIRSLFAAVILIEMVGAHAQAPPSMSLITAPLADPQTAYTSFYTSSTTHTTGAVAWSGYAPEIYTLARALGSTQLAPSGPLTNAQFIQRVYQYVQLNIEPEFRFGLGKGARGAAIDQSGTPFDQAQLMVFILRAAGITANYQIGTITLNASQFGLWTGLVNNLNQTAQTFNVSAQAACTLLADGGIPASVNGSTTCTGLSGNLSTVTLMHVWVSANGNLYDPSYKPHVLKTGIDIAGGMGCESGSTPTCGSSVLAAATTGATQSTLSATVPYIQNVNETQIDNTLGTFATNLESAIKEVNRFAQVQEIVSGGLIDTTYSPAISNSLPYPTPNVFATWTGDIPDAFRTTIEVQFLGLDQTFYADELYGRDLRVTTYGLPSTWNRSSAICADGVQIGSTASYAASAPMNDMVTLIINHPYAADAAGTTSLTGTYGDDTQVLFAGQDLRNSSWGYNSSTSGFEYANLISILWSTGFTGPGYQDFVAHRKDPGPLPLVSTTYEGATTNVVLFRQAHPSQGAQFLVQNSAAASLLGGVSKTKISQQHTLGVVFAIYMATTVTAQLNVASSLSVSQVTGISLDRSAAFSTFAMTSAALEGSVLQQAEEGWDELSGLALLRYANTPGQSQPYLQVTGSNFVAASALLSANGYSPSRLSSIQNYLNNNYQLIIPEVATPPSISMTNGTFYLGSSAELATGSSKIAYSIGERVKGSASALGNDPTSGVQNAVKVANYSVRNPKAYSIDRIEGQTTLTPPPDLVTGTGTFPQSLSFTRTYASNDNPQDICTEISVSGSPGSTCVPGRDGSFRTYLPGGWRHSLEISAEWANSGMEALGATSALRATTTIADMYVAFDLARNPSMATQLAGVFVGYSMAASYMHNSVAVHVPGKSLLFGKLPDGTYDGPINDPSAAISLTGTRSGPFIYGSGAYYDYTPVALTYYSSSGDVATFTYSWYSVFNGTGYQTAPSFVVKTWTDPTGAVATFNYTATVSADGSRDDMVLTSVTNNIGRSLTFQTAVANDLQFIQKVTDDSGRFVTYTRTWAQTGSACISDSQKFTLIFESVSLPECTTQLTVTGADQLTSTFTYVAAAGAPSPSSSSLKEYPMWQWFTPSSATLPYLTFTYDGQWHIANVTDSLSYVTSVYTAGVSREFDKYGETVDATGAPWITYADQYGDHLFEIDPLNRVTAFFYDDWRRAWQKIFPAQNYDNYYYDARSNRTSVSHYPKPGSTLAATSESKTFMEGPSVSVCSNLRTCNKPSTETDANGNQTTYSYIATGQVQRILGPPITAPTISVPVTSLLGSAQTDLCYGLNGPLSLLVGTIRTVGDGTTRVNAYTYNSTNHYVLQTATEDPATTYVAPTTGGGSCTTASKSSALALITTYTFDSVGNPSTVVGPTAGGVDSTTYTFDPVRRLTRVQAPLGAFTRYCYDADGELVATQKASAAGLTDPNPSTSAQCSSSYPTGIGGWQGEFRAYYPTGDLLSVTDALGDQTVYAYDGVGRQVLVQDPDGRQTASAYDPAGQLIASWRGGSGWLSGSGTSTAPSSELPTYTTTWTPSSYTGNGPFRYGFYSYDANGTKTDGLDANNNDTRYVLDGLERVQFTLFPDPTNGSLCTAPSTDSGSAPTCTGQQTYEQYGYDAVGNRISLQTRKGESLVYSFDAGNRLYNRAPAGYGAVTTSFNLLGEPLQVVRAAWGSYPTHTTQYTYDGIGRKLTESNDSRSVGYAYDTLSSTNDNAGKLVRITWPDSFYIAYQYDALGRLTYVRENSTTAGELANFSYDPLSRRNYECLGGQSVSCQGGTATNEIQYGYDLASRLQSLTHTLNTTSVGFTYGRYNSGQVRSISVSNATYFAYPSASSTAFVANDLNEYSTVGGQSAFYDNNGNLTSWTQSGVSQGYTYDSENRLLTVSSGGNGIAAYDYDGLGRRVSKTVSGVVTQYLLSGDEEIAELDSSGTNVLRRYVDGPAIDDRVAHIEYTSGSAVHTYYHTDHHGSVVAMTDLNGVVQQQFTYDEYGNSAQVTGEAFRYTGRRFDSESGLYYYRSRYYQPTLGRFLQTDSVGYKDDLNLYAYVGNDPLDKTDPTGTTCTQGADGKYACQVDWMIDAKGNVTQRKDFTAAQSKQVAAFEKSYTAAVNKLASNPSAKTTISVPGEGKTQTVTAGYVARSAANRVVEAAPSVTDPRGPGAVTHSDGMGGVVTTVNSPGLRGEPIYGGAMNSEEMRQMTVAHEAMHGTYVDSAFAGKQEFQNAHQLPYDEAALELLRGNQ